jgi:hypothetical protein
MRTSRSCRVRPNGECVRIRFQANGSDAVVSARGGTPQRTEPFSYFPPPGLPLSVPCVGACRERAQTPPEIGLRLRLGLRLTGRLSRGSNRSVTHHGYAARNEGAPARTNVGLSELARLVLDRPLAGQ